MPYRSGIRRKITFGFYITVAVVSGFSVFTFMELRSLEKKVVIGEIISEFFNTTLEIRRFEKNYFLFKQEADYQETVRYVKASREMIEKNIASFTMIVDRAQVLRLKEDLAKYGILISQHRVIAAGDQWRFKSLPALESRIRETGKDITAIAETISRNERQYMQRTLKKSGTVLIISIIILSAAVMVMGRVFSLIVVRPLKLLEHSMEVIADGRFETMRIDSKDREIVSLTRAFNNMLRELELRQRHLVHSEKLASLGTLLSGVAHELNNPLSNISSSCQILLEELTGRQSAKTAAKPVEAPSVDPEFAIEMLSQIDEQTDRARNIVRSLLEFSRDKDFKKENLQLKQVVEETIRFLKSQVPPKVTVSVDVAEGVEIFADKQRIQQAFLNLIKNAVEAVEEEGVVTVKARFHSALEKASDDTAIYNYLRYQGKCTMEDDTVDISIADSGAGIPPELIPKVFDPFFTTKDVGKGSGLGLFIVHQIIEEHDGCIAVDSSEGKGSTFLIRLPAKKK